MSPHLHGAHALTQARRARLLDGAPGGEGYAGPPVPCPSWHTAIHRTIAPPPPAPVHDAAPATPTPRPSRWPHIAVLAVFVALLGTYAWTTTASRIPTQATIIAERVAR